MGIKLFQHNQTAYESALAMLDDTGKAAVIHPTGTGKSFIGFKLCEDFPQQTVCWLSPSDYIFRTQLENLKVATDGYAPENIRFITYAKLMQMEEAEIGELTPDFIILDEFHRCGAELWGQGVQRLLALYPDAPVLGLSATNIRYLDHQRDMADELFDGNVASEMTLGDALVRGILSPPRYVLSAYSCQKDLERYRKRVRRAKNRAVRDAAARYLEALRRTLDMADGLDIVFDKHMTDRTGKYIVFCANKEHMDAMIAKAGEWFARVDKHPRIYSVYADDPAASRSFAQFKADDKDDHLRLLYCIDALNEGIHVDGVSGVILLRPTVSPIIYKQQIGRTLSAGKAEDPVIFDIVMNIDNLYSIDSIQEEMQVAMTYYRSLAAEGQIVNDRFQVFDELRDCRELFEKLNDTLTASWEIMYQYAVQYFQAHGNLDVAERYKTPDGYSLGSWVNIQRRLYRGELSGHLSEERIAKLDAIDMLWDSARDRTWNKFYTAACAYYEQNGHLRVPAGYIAPNNIPLGRWITHMRTYRKSGSCRQYFTPERIKALDSMGMIWDVIDYRWVTNYASAARYHRQYGDLEVPVDYVDADGIRLGLWLSRMRRAYERREGYNISDEQIEKLTELGMVWGIRPVRKWERGYAAAKKYYEENGDLNVPSRYVDGSGYRLGDWVSNQREKYRAGKMRRERVTKLNAIGMVWEREDPWELRFALAEAYFRQHGDLLMAPDYNVDGVCLGKWINEQKNAYHGKRPKHPLTGEQIRKLESIGIDWRSTFDIVWERRYLAVKDYYEKHGDIDIPQDVILSDGKSIGHWLSIQRRSYKSGKLSPERFTLLSDVGMRWEKMSRLPQRQ